MSRFEMNYEAAKSRVDRYPFIVETIRNDNFPNPSRHKEIVIGKFCRLPTGEDHIIWMFELKDDYENFKYLFPKIIKPEEECLLSLKNSKLCH